jgi:hypothetical protein
VAWAAAGHARTVFPVPIAELVRITAGPPADADRSGTPAGLAAIRDRGPEQWPVLASRQVVSLLALAWPIAGRRLAGRAGTNDVVRNLTIMDEA